MLLDHVPEWLPMYGKKVRIFYHGMKRQCNGCFHLDHMKWECKEEKINWKAYVNRLRSTGNFEDVLFGQWLEDRDQSKNLEGVKAKEAVDLRELIKESEKSKKTGSERTHQGSSRIEESPRQLPVKESRQTKNRFKTSLEKQGQKHSARPFEVKIKIYVHGLCCDQSQFLPLFKFW
jgi:hypothetical protein